MALAGLYGALPGPGADLLVEERAQAIAARNANGALVPAPGLKGNFAVKRWLAARGDAVRAPEAALRPLWICSPSACLADVRGRKVAFLKATAEIAKPCPVADVIVAQYPLRRRCRGRLITIDRFDVWRNGAHALTLTENGVQVTTARGEQGQRPWSWAPRPRTK